MPRRPLQLVRMTLAFAVSVWPITATGARFAAGRCGRGAGGAVPGRGLPVPNHGPCAHHALQIGVHYRLAGGLVPLFSIIPGLRPPGARPPRWNAFLGAAMAFTGIVLLTAPAATQASAPLLCWAMRRACCPI